MKLVCFVLLFTAVAAVQKCCPQPASEGKCGCCPDACCCMCENVTVTVPPQTSTTREICTMQGLDVAFAVDSEQGWMLCTLQGLDVAFAVDSSSSIGEQGWIDAMNFMKQLVGHPAWMGPGVETLFAMVTYSSFAEIIFEIQDQLSVAQMETAIDGAPYLDEFTNTIEAMNFTIDIMENRDRDDAVYADLCFFFSDGLMNEFFEQLPETAARLQAECSVVIAVGIGPEILDAIGQDELAQITGDPNNVFFQSDYAVFLQEIEQFIYDVSVRVCETIFPPTPAPATSVPVETCKCCCPPLPDPCMGNRMFGGDDTCGCCRFDNY